MKKPVVETLKTCIQTDKPLQKNASAFDSNSRNQPSVLVREIEKI